MKRKHKIKKQINTLLTLLITFIICIITIFNIDINSNNEVPTYNLFDIPEYNENNYVVLNDNKPNFNSNDYSIKEKEIYSNLDNLNRCGPALAIVGLDTMPTEKRSSIGMIKPTGWHTIKYNNIKGKYLYNRCHLIGYQLTGENANKKNLITCTRYMNTVGMLKFENEIAKYIEESNNHVLYRVTPIFKDNNLLAHGVNIEAKSIEDNGLGISFNVFVYNVQPGIKIDYKTGNSWLIKDTSGDVSFNYYLVL